MAVPNVRLEPSRAGSAEGRYGVADRRSPRVLPLRQPKTTNARPASSRSRCVIGGGPVVETNLLFVVGAVLTLLAVGGALSRRFGQSVIPAYILVGVLVGPHAPAVGEVRLTLLQSPDSLRLLADLGIVLLLFFVGLELGLERLFRQHREFVRASLADVGISLPLGIAVGFLFGFGWLEALFIGAIVFNSSTVIIAKSLLDLGWITNPESETILGVVVIEDIVTALYLAVLSAILLGGENTTALLIESVARAFAFLLLLGVIAYYGASYIERAFDTRSSELFLLGLLGVTALLAGMGLMVGVSEAVAAFLVGTAFGRTGLREQMEGLVPPMRDLFAAVFFFVIGTQTDPRLLVDTAGYVLVAVTITVPGQLVSGYLAGRLYGLGRVRAVRVGCSLTPRGEFSLVIAAFLVAVGPTVTLAETVPAFTVGYVLLTSVLGTVLMRHCGVLERLVAS